MWTSDLWCINVDACVVCHVDPRHNAGDLVEVHGATRAQTVDDLLHPGGTAFWRRHDEDVCGIRLIVQAMLPAFLGGEIFKAFMHFLDRCWAFEVFFAKHVSLPSSYCQSLL